MSHRLSERQIRARIREFAPERLREREQLAALDRRWSELVVGIFNARLAAGRRVLLWPTVGAALAAGHPWLHLRCPGCATTTAVDLRVICRPPDTAIGAILPSLRCRLCEGRNPPPVVIGLSTRHDAL
jgi:hypothetical protein